MATVESVVKEFFEGSNGTIIAVIVAFFVVLLTLGKYRDNFRTGVYLLCMQFHRVFYYRS